MCSFAVDSVVLVKRLAPSVKDPDVIAMISDNEEMYPQEPLRIEDIKELWYVKRILDWRMAPPKQFEVKI